MLGPPQVPSIQKKAIKRTPVTLRTARLPPQSLDSPMLDLSTSPCFYLKIKKMRFSLSDFDVESCKGIYSPTALSVSWVLLPPSLGFSISVFLR
jgi:hypothetical protein